MFAALNNKIKNICAVSIQKNLKYKQLLSEEKRPFEIAAAALAHVG